MWLVSDTVVADKQDMMEEVAQITMQENGANKTRGSDHSSESWKDLRSTKEPVSSCQMVPKCARSDAPANAQTRGGTIPRESPRPRRAVPPAKK